MLQKPKNMVESLGEKTRDSERDRVPSFVKPVAPCAFRLGTSRRGIIFFTWFCSYISFAESAEEELL
jgi:hypothetical protein